MTQQEMYEALAQGYSDAADAAGAERARVGDAWMDALQLMPPIQLYTGDGSHPTLPGSFLAACVIYTQITGEACGDTSFTPDGLDANDRDALAAVADGLL